MSSSSEDEGSFHSALREEDEGNKDACIGAAGPAEDQSTSAIPASVSTDSHARQRSQSTDSRRGRAQYRHSLPEPVPAVPAIPPHLLATGRPATLLQRRTAGHDTRRDALNPLSSPILHVQRPSTSGEDSLKKSPLLGSPTLLSPRIRHDIANRAAPPSPDNRARRKSLSALPARSHRETLDRLENRSQGGVGGKMNRYGKGRREDLFLELANDEVSAEERPPSRGERASSRLSFANKRRSLPAQGFSSSPGDQRPRTSGSVFGQRPPSRLDNQASELHRHVERYRNIPGSFQADDVVSVSTRSRSGLPLRYSERNTTSPHQLQESPRSPELPQYGRRRPSLTATSSHRLPPSRLGNRQQDAYSESPADGSDRKQSLQDSSAESETQETVWDELDDLKSRIKKLELTGKLPPTSGATISNESSDRPRTATTAPTTIDSSPKHPKPEKKPEAETVAEAEPEDEPPADAVNGPSITNIHPNLHAALAKAKPLLNGSLYRSLEATAADALQLAAMTGSAGPQGTAFTAAAIINGLTVSDRHVRRKADTMCRNLTDLCLALCEGKHEAPTIISSPVPINTPAQQSPSLLLPRNRLDPHSGASRAGNRPMSRLEARRTSILGSQAGSSIGASPGLSGGEDLSASEQESTPSNLRSTSLRRTDRATSRLQTSRLQRYSDAGDDEDPTLRPPSRAMTDLGRAKPLGPRDYAGNAGHGPQRSPSLRDSLVARRTSANAAAFEGNHNLTRVASLSSDSGTRRRFHDPATPPVLEEEGGPEEYQPPPSTFSSGSKRRIMSYGQYGSRRAGAEVPSRAGSLGQRRGVVVE